MRRRRCGGRLVRDRWLGMSIISVMCWLICLLLVSFPHLLTLAMPCPYLTSRFDPGDGKVYLRTATSLEGPWTPDVQVYKSEPIKGGLVYAGVQHPYLDPTGQTLVVSFTNNNHIEVIKVAFA